MALHGIAGEEVSSRVQHRSRSLSLERSRLNEPGISSDFATGIADLEEEESGESSEDSGSTEDSDDPSLSGGGGRHRSLTRSNKADMEEMAKLRVDLAVAKQALGVANTKASNATAEAKKAKENEARKSSENDELKAKLEAVAALAKSTAAAEALSTEVAALRVASTAAQGELHQAEGAKAASDAEAVELKSELAAAAGDADASSLALQAEVTRLGAELHERTEALTTAEATATTAEDALAAKAAEYERLSEQHADATAAKTLLEEKASSLAAQLTAAASETQAALSEAAAAAESALTVKAASDAAAQGSSAGTAAALTDRDENANLRAQLDASAKALIDERATYGRAQLAELKDAAGTHEAEVGQLKASHAKALEAELQSLRRSHTLELESMRETLSEALATDAANAVEREEVRRAAEREASRHRLARTLESELKAIAGAMDDGEIQSMWDSHPTLDSIRRRRRGTFGALLLRLALGYPATAACCRTRSLALAPLPAAHPLLVLSWLCRIRVPVRAGELTHEEMIMELASRAKAERSASPPPRGGAGKR